MRPRCLPPLPASRHAADYWCHFFNHEAVLGDASAHVGFLNCERIAERSHIHGWQVAPHYHEGLTQIFCFASGRVRGQIDYEAADLSAPAVVWVPALVSHGFLYPPQMEGWVVTLPSAVMARLAAAMPWLSPWLSRAAVLTGEIHVDELRLLTLFETIEREHGSSGEERDTVLEALVRLVLAEVHRGLRCTGGWLGRMPDRHFNLVRQFQILVDRDLCFNDR
jgi:AraC family transcriptional activator of pobA